MHQRIIFIVSAVLIVCLGNSYAKTGVENHGREDTCVTGTGISVQTDETLSAGDVPSTVISRCFFDHIAEAYELEFKLDKSLKRCFYIKIARSAVVNASGINRAFSSTVVLSPDTLQVIRI